MVYANIAFLFFRSAIFAYFVLTVMT